MPHCLMWCIWRERNSRSFEGREWSILEFKSFLLSSNGVLFYHLFLVFTFLCCLIFVSWFLDVFASFVHFLCTGLCSFKKNFILLIKKKKLWGLGGEISLCITWTIWRKCNHYTFEGIEHLPLELKLFVVCSMYDWMAALSSHSM